MTKDQAGDPLPSHPQLSAEILLHRREGGGGGVYFGASDAVAAPLWLDRELLMSKEGWQKWLLLFLTSDLTLMINIMFSLFHHGLSELLQGCIGHVMVLILHFQSKTN